MYIFRSEDVSKLIPSWEPWWMYYNDGKIEDMSQKDNFKDKCPKLCDIKDFAQLTVMFYFITMNDKYIVKCYFSKRLQQIVLNTI